MSKEKPCWLGIDIGTTSLKVSLIDRKDFGADLKSSIGETGFEQCPKTIIQVIDHVIVPLIEKFRDDIAGIGITGQMHGLVLWKHLERKSKLQEQTAEATSGADANFDPCPTLSGHLEEFTTSNLYTWQDQRCTPSFLASLPPVSDPHQPLATGHGCATLFWLLHHERLSLEKAGYSCCGTIMDLFTSLLCDLECPVTSDQLAASLGYFQSDTKQWDPVLQNTPEFPYSMLPSIVEAGTQVGSVSPSCCGWPKGVPVFVGMGDVQCAMYSLARCPNKAIVNIGTSIQLGFLCKSSDVPRLRQESPPTISFFPFFRPFHLALCAGLNGGNAVKHFVHCLSCWMSDLGCESQVDTNNLMSKLQVLAEKDGDNVKSKGNSPPYLSVQPSFFGERHDPEMGGSISGISLANFQGIGHVFRCLCEGIIHHLSTMVPPSYLQERGLEKLLVCGSVPSKNRFVMEAIEKVYGERGLSMEKAQSSSEEINSAKGAAHVVKDRLLCTPGSI